LSAWRVRLVRAQLLTQQLNADSATRKSFVS
jgi:hypothetical protein